MQQVSRRRTELLLEISQRCPFPSEGRGHKFESCRARQSNQASSPNLPADASSATCRSVADVKTAINRFVAETNANPKPFVWAADPRRVLAAIKLGKQALESVH